MAKGGQTQQWTVVPVSHRITLTYRISNIQLVCRKIKSCSNPNKGPLQPFFRNKKAQAPYLQTLVFSLI
jgi:hypothetical protein